MLEYSEWEELSSEQEEYLVQLRGPHDMFQYILRDLVTTFNVSTAAILFDDTFIIHHRSNLLMNIPVRYLHICNDKDDSGMRLQTFTFDNRHHINKLQANNASLAEQIQMMMSMELKNFFILAR